MDSKDIKQRIQILKDFIQNAQREMDHLQDTCPHKEVELKLVGYGGSSSLQKVCTICEIPVAYATQQEIDEWKKPQNPLDSEKN